MKPCSKNRKLLAWLALDALDAANAQELRAHVQNCEGCRHYLAEISALTQKLATAQSNSNIQPSESFHQSVVRKLEAERSVSIWNIVRPLLPGRLPNWRIALPALAAAACLAIFALVSRPAVRSHQTSNPSTTPPGPSSAPELPPTFANYQMVANQSLDKFDELLSKQGNRNPFSTRTYAASRMEE